MKVHFSRKRHGKLINAQEYVFPAARRRQKCKCRNSSSPRRSLAHRSSLRFNLRVAKPGPIYCRVIIEWPNIVDTGVRMHGVIVIGEGESETAVLWYHSAVGSNGFSLNRDRNWVSSEPECISLKYATVRIRKPNISSLEISKFTSVICMRSIWEMKFRIGI